MNQVASDIRAAADHIERYGWVQGEAFGDTTSGRPSPACVLGALGIATGDYSVAGRQSEALRQVGPFGLTQRYRDAGRVLISVLDCVAEWNDRPERTKAEVLATLRRIADSIDPQPQPKPAEFFLGPPQPLAAEDPQSTPALA